MYFNEQIEKILNGRGLLTTKESSDIADEIVKMLEAEGVLDDDPDCDFDEFDFDEEDDD